MKNWIFNEKVHLIRITSEPFYAFSQDITMLKKWFISAFPEIEKISQNLGPKLGQTLWKIESLMKRCIGSAKPHRTVFRFFARYYDAEEEIHKRISWNWENISKSGPKVRPNIMKIESLMKRCIGSAKPHRTVFRFFARYYDAEEEIHKRISWNWENISKSGPKVRPNNMKNWIFNEKVHRIRITSELFSLFRKILWCKKVIHKRISWNWENISKSGPKLVLTLWKIESLMKRCIGSTKTS